MRAYIRFTFTYKLFKLIIEQLLNVIETIGNIIILAREFFIGLKNKSTSLTEIMYQCYRFGITSLPITLSIVGMTSIIISMQVAGEMVKQGAGNYVGMLISILMIREESVIMAGFAIISMIGSSLASEIATMKVTEQIDAIKVLKVNPIHYLLTPRVLSGILMMPLIVIIVSLFGILCGGLAANLVSGLTYKAYFDSVWFGLNTHDIYVCLLKAISFGFTISLISCACGLKAENGAKGVGEATTKSVVWSFIAIVILDLIFAGIFFY